MATRVESAASRARTHLKGALHDLSARLATEQRFYRGIDRSIFTLYGIECFLRALAATPRGRNFVLKGGNLFRVWEGMGSFRPTGDLDMQCISDARQFEDIVDLRREVGRIVGTKDFRNATGLIFDLDGFKLDPIRKGNGGHLLAYRLEGKAMLGEPHAPAGRPAEVPFCLEVTYGPAPPGAVELARWQPLAPRQEAFEVQASRPEWMAAEKFHSVSTRGEANSRLKDYRDLMVLLDSPTFDDQLLHGCVRQVFEELGHGHLIPESAAGLATLSAVFATPDNERLWQERRWAEWEGRTWLAGRDPSLSQAIALVVTGLERKGLLAELPSSRAVRALGDAHQAADQIRQRGPQPVPAGRIATALAALAAEVAPSRSADIAWRWDALAARSGAPRRPSETLQGIIDVLRQNGLIAALDQGWERGRGGGLLALDRVRRDLVAPVTGKMPARPGADAPVSEPAAAPGKRRPRVLVEKSPDEVMADGVMLLSEGRPGTHVWFGGLGKVLTADGAAIPQVDHLALEMPSDARAPLIWRQIAQRHELEQDLEKALTQARRTLGIETMAPGPA